MNPDLWPVPSPGARATFPVSLSKARLTGALWGPSQHGACSGATSSASAWPPAGRNGPGTLVVKALEPDSSYPFNQVPCFCFDVPPRHTQILPTFSSRGTAPIVSYPPDVLGVQLHVPRGPACQLPPLSFHRHTYAAAL